MEPRRRFAFTTGQKAILWIGVLLCLWQVLMLPGVFDAILNFYAAGVIPGTEIVLEPDTILRFMFASLFSAVLIVCYRKFGRRPGLDVRQASLTGKKLQLYASFIEAVRPVMRVQGKLRRLWSICAWYGNGAVQFLQAGLEWLKPYVSYVVRLLGYLAALAWRGFVNTVIWILAVESALFVWLWRWSEPHIRQFDKWLERRVNANRYGARLVRIVRTGSEILPGRSVKKPASQSQISPEQ